MAAQPFDKATADKLVEAFNNLNAETKDTLSNLDKIVDTEKRMVDIAKQLGQAYKTQQDKLDEQLKGKSLQEKLSSKFVNSEKKLNEFAQARINSYIKIESLQNELSTKAAELLVEQSKDPTSDTVIALQDLINKKSTELNLEEHLLKNSASKLESLKRHNFLLNAANELIDLYNKALEMGVKLLNKMGDLASGLATKLNIPTTLAGTFERILDVFNQIDTAATNVRQKFGLLPSQGAIFEKNIREASIELAEFGINAEQLGGTMKQIGSTFTSLQSMEKGLVKDVSIMSAQFGVASETSVKFLQTLGGVSGKSAIAKQNMLGLAKFAANAYGVGLDAVLDDVANASEEARMFAGKNADEMVRAAAQARQMGTTLDNMAKTAKGLLDFESSIQSELKASALIGKNINFNEARRLAFQGKVVEANKLILDQAKKIKFNQLNPIAQEAFAKAAGKSVKELQDMLNAEENLKEALKSKDPLVRAEAEKKKQMAEMMKNDPIAAKKAAQAEYEKGLIQEKNQTRMKQLQNEINAIFMEFIGPILEEIGPIFTQLLKYIKDNRVQIKEFAQEIGKAFLVFKNLQYISQYAEILGKSVGKVGSALKSSASIAGGFYKIIGSVFTTLSTGTSILSTVGKTIGSVFSGFGKFISGAGGIIGNIFGKIGGGISVFSKLAPIFGAVAKFLGPIGLVVSVIQGGIAFFKAFNETTGTVSQKAVAGLKAVVNALVIEPLKMVWDFLKKIPSFLAEIDFGAIYKDVTNFLLDALTSLPDKIEELFSGGGGGIEWGKIFANIGRLAIEIIVFHFVKLPIAIAKTVGKLGLLILKAFGLNAIADGIASVADTLYTILKWPFESVYNWVMDKLGGKSPSEIGLAIVDGIKSVVDMLFDVLTYPFKKGFELIKSAVSEVSAFLKDTFSGAFTFIIGALEKVWEKMKGIGSFISDTIGKTFSFVGRIVGVSEETPSKTTTESKTSVKTDDLLINTIVNSNRVLAEKLDKLTSMMASGQIAVYIDGQRANQLLATSNSKFGSFGQATTN
jgi:hypothetical protein